MDAQTDEVGLEPSTGAHHTNVTGQGQAEAGTDGGTVDGGHHRDRGLEDRARPGHRRRACPASKPPSSVGSGDVGAEVGSGAEGPTDRTENGRPA